MVRHASCLLYVYLLMLTNASKQENTTITESPAIVVRKIVYLITNAIVYDKNVRPFFGEKPVQVVINYYVGDIVSLSDSNNDITVNIVVVQVWHDPRLQFTPINNLTKLLLVRDFGKLIWLPDTYIRYSKSLASMQLSDSTLASAKITVKHDGAVVYRNTFTTTVDCSMDLKYFPVDQQNCKLIMTSYAYTNDDLNLKCTSKEKILGGLYDALICELKFKRILGYYINQIYVPAFLIVVISWIPFWLDRNDNHARVGLGVTTVLTITTLVTSTNESLPKVSYIKYIDIYLIVCFLMVFLSLIEFATIGFFESEEQSQCTGSETKEADEPDDMQIDDKSIKASKKTKKKRNTAWIDKVSRVLFPAVFITFNLIYVGVLFFIRNRK